MRTLICGEGGSVLVAAATSTGTVALGCEGLAAAVTAPSGVPVYPADTLPDDLEVDVVTLLPCEAVTEGAVRAWAAARGVPLVAGAGPQPLESSVPVVAVSAGSTASGKTALTRRVARHLLRSGARVAVARHPIANLLMHGRFEASIVSSPPELAEGSRPLEEREELAPLVGAGIPCITGLDPERVLAGAARNANVVVWDGGGAARPWVRPDVNLVVVDLLREVPHDRITEADAVVLTKADTAPGERMRRMEAEVREVNPGAAVIAADLTIAVQDGAALKDSRAVVVEDWSALALGGLRGGAGAVAARRFRCGVVDPRPFAVGAVASCLAALPQLDGVIPSLGRTPQEVEDLAASVLRTPGDVVLWASNADPAGVIGAEARPVIRAFGELTEVAGPSLQEVLAPLVR